MTALRWDQVGTRKYETGVDRGVLYLPNNQGVYEEGVAWNGLTTVTESPSGAESNPQYADNIKYLDLQSAEEFGGTIEALTYPDEFGVCDGSAEAVPGVRVGQQPRRVFGFSYRSLIGNDTQGNDYGYKLHLIYGARVAPSERGYTTVNDSPEPIAFSWEFTTTPVEVPGFKPSAVITVDSNAVSASALTALQNALYGTDGSDPRLPLPAEVLQILANTTVEVETVRPTFDSATDTITIPSVTGVVYLIDGEVVTGNVVITEDTVVKARPASGYRFTNTSDDDFTFEV